MDNRNETNDANDSDTVDSMEALAEEYRHRSLGNFNRFIAFDTFLKEFSHHHTTLTKGQIVKKARIQFSLLSELEQENYRRQGYEEAMKKSYENEALIQEAEKKKNSKKKASSKKKSSQSEYSIEKAETQDSSHHRSRKKGSKCYVIGEKRIGGKPASLDDVLQPLCPHFKIRKARSANSSQNSHQNLIRSILRKSRKSGK